MEKILFIVPPNMTYEDFVHPSYNVRIVRKINGDFGSVLTEMPLGVLSMSAYIKKHAQARTRLVDFNIVLNKIERFAFRSFEELFSDFLAGREWSEYSPDIICISALFTPAYENLLGIGRVCRALFPGALILAGGSVPTNMYQEIFRDSGSFDALCYGEGELPLLGLIKAGDRRRYLENDPAWITAAKAASGKRFKHNLIGNLDEIPFYDYGICETDEYGLNPAITAYAGVKQKAKNFHVMTSRGCTFRCCFCASFTVHGRKMRYHGIERVREDFKRLRDEFGARVIVFQDDHFMADKERAFKIIEIIKELGVTAVFQNGLALYALDRRMLQALKGAGVDQLLLSVESGSNRVLKEIMHKPFDLSIVKRVARDCRELGIYTNVNILIGLPGETKEDINDTRLFLRTINANWFLIFCSNPLVGSEMFKVCLEKKYLKGNYLNCDYKKAIVETEDFTAEYIQDMAYLLNLELNFVENSDYKLGNYETALKGFENAIRAKSDHAIAYYCASRCYAKMGNKAKAREYMETSKKIVSVNPFWKKYAEMFNIHA
ncbi:MAG: radical SAM protein [Candidatus Omnitrophota bacterium]